MTRAKQLLYMSAAKYRLIWGSPRIMTPSRFLSELPDEHYEVAGGYQEEHLEYSDSDEAFAIGTVVRHKSFGKGIIKKAYQSSMGLTYDVFFPSSQSIKTLVAKYAKLQIQ